MFKTGTPKADHRSNNRDRKYILYVWCLMVLMSIVAPSNEVAAQQAIQVSVEPGKQVEQQLKVKGGNDEIEIPYLLYLPMEYDSKPDQRWPVVLFLHGRGESSGPLSLVAKWGPPKFAERGDELPFILVSPQCPEEGVWSDEERQQGLDSLLKHISSEYRTDETKVSLTGLSMGGFGSWKLVATYPKRFSCAVPICGSGDEKSATRLVDLPIWAFHGSEDSVVPVADTEKMVNAIKQAGGTKIRFTTLEHIGHNSWSAAYATPALLQWMLDQTAVK